MKKVSGELYSEQPQEVSDGESEGRKLNGKQQFEDDTEKIAHFLMALRNKAKEEMARKEEIERKQKEVKPDEPISVLPNLQVVAKIFSYYGYLGEEQNVLQYVSRTTRAYAKSSYIKEAKEILKVHRNAPYYDWPN